ncbi:MAG: hypothetical protein ACLTYH_08130 [Streptococcus salivarius]
MADNGRLYQGFDRNYVEAMKDFCQQADVIIPNLTEAALLTDTPYLEAGSYDEATVEKASERVDQAWTYESYFDRYLI